MLEILQIVSPLQFPGRIIQGWPSLYDCESTRPVRNPWSGIIKKDSFQMITAEVPGVISVIPTMNAC